MSYYVYFTACVSGDNVEEVFLETAKKIYQNIQDGKWVKPYAFLFLAS